MTFAPRCLVHEFYAVADKHEVSARMVDQVSVLRFSLMVQLKFESLVVHDADVLVRKTVRKTCVVRYRGVSGAEDVRTFGLEELKLPSYQSILYASVNTDVPCLGHFPCDILVRNLPWDYEVDILVIES